EWLELRFFPPVPADEVEAVILFAPEDPTSLVGLLLGDENATTMRVEPFERNEVLSPGVVRFSLAPPPNDLAVVTLLFDARRTPTVVPMIDAVGLVRRDPAAAATATSAPDAADQAAGTSEADLRA